MDFLNRHDAGEKLKKSLAKYKGRDGVVLALPRGGVVTALPIAKYLRVPLDLVITRKIGHPFQPEYALAAIAENSTILVGNKTELSGVDQDWLKKEIKKEAREATRRRKVYLAGRKPEDLRGKIAIIIDDGIATGLTMKAAIAAVKKKKPSKIVIAVPVAPEEVIFKIAAMVDEVVCLVSEPAGKFLGSIGDYYKLFPQVSDEEVVALLNSYRKQD